MQSREFLESRQEMERLLREETIGYLGLSMGDDPYVVPLNYAYVDGRILFHCAMTGRKLKVDPILWTTKRSKEMKLLCQYRAVKLAYAPPLESGTTGSDAGARGCRT